MREKETGGPAFPSCSYNMKGGYDITGGMTLRDYFAAKAMQGMLANTDEDDVEMHRHGQLFPYLAINAYEMADSMMEARK